jgi:hypothetical protein
MSRCKKNKTSNLISLTLGDMYEKTARETTQKQIAFCVNNWVYICSGDNGYQRKVNRRQLTRYSTGLPTVHMMSCGGSEVA